MDQDTRIMALEYIWNAWDNVTKVYEDGAVFSAYQNQTTTSSCYQGVPTNSRYMTLNILYPDSTLDDRLTNAALQWKKLKFKTAAESISPKCSGLDSSKERSPSKQT